MRFYLITIVTFMISACSVSVPNGVEPVKGFELSRYVGTWYEIARMDHSFERGLEKVSATYSLKEDGGVKVLNKGFDTKDQSWSDAVGRAYFVADAKTGHLKVSFFRPFYGSYVIFVLDKAAYQYAFISGDTKEYLWFLSRTPTVSETLKSTFVKEAKLRGFDTDKLIWVDQK